MTYIEIEPHNSGHMQYRLQILSDGSPDIVGTFSSFLASDSNSIPDLILLLNKISLHSLAKIGKPELEFRLAT